MFVRKIALALASLLSSVTFAATFTSAANADDNGFVLPSDNIACAAYADILRCSISSGLKPKPSNPVDCNAIDDLVLSRNGTVRVDCLGGTGEDYITLDHLTLSYNRPWQRNGFRCLANTSGLTCRARNGKGFFLSRNRWSRV
jgi:hypothetical protein